MMHCVEIKAQVSIVSIAHNYNSAILFRNFWILKTKFQSGNFWIVKRKLLDTLKEISIWKLLDIQKEVSIWKLLVSVEAEFFSKMPPRSAVRQKYKSNVVPILP